MGRYKTREEYMEFAREVWEQFYPLITEEFLPWVKANGYWDIKSVDESAQKETGQKWKETVRKSLKTYNNWYLPNVVGQCKRRAPKDLRNRIHDAAFDIVSRQAGASKLEPIYILQAVGDTSTSAFCSLMGLSGEEYKTGTMAKEYRDTTLAFQMNLMSKPASFEVVIPLVATVNEILEKGVQAYLQRLEGR